jgi:hypothetical protein
MHSAKVVKIFSPTALLVKKHRTILICFVINAFIHWFLTVQGFNAFLVLARFRIASNAFMTRFFFSPNALCVCQNLKSIKTLNVKVAKKEHGSKGNVTTSLVVQAFH